MPKSIIEGMKWLPFQDIIVYVAYNIECPAEHLKILLKVLSMLKIKIIYDETIDNEDVPKAVEIMCINCGKKYWLLVRQ